MAYHQNRPIAGIWHSAFGDGVTSRIAGWAGEVANLRPYIACHWSAIQWAKGVGYRYYDFGGIDSQFAELLLANQRITGDVLDSAGSIQILLRRRSRIAAKTTSVHIQSRCESRDTAIVLPNRRSTRFSQPRAPLPQRIGLARRCDGRYHCHPQGGLLAGREIRNHNVPNGQTLCIMANRKAVVRPNSSIPFNASRAPISCQ